uniref:Uncharacterized protein n=1 Tax=Plectus sambesii TaxID=2011161 RepID=A0A914X1A3_9BILA
MRGRSLICINHLNDSIVMTVAVIESAGTGNVFRKVRYGEYTKWYEQFIDMIDNNLYVYTAPRGYIDKELMIEERADWCSGLKPSLISLKDAGSIPAEGGPSPNQGAHPSVGRGNGSSYAANIPATGRPLFYPSHQSWPNVASRQRARRADPGTLRDNR